MTMRIYVSGCYSGPSPSAGLGIARSLRAAYPAAVIVGVDYWSGSSGLSHEVFDEVLLQPSWEHIDHALHAQRILEKLESGALWISALDVEVRWLAQKIGPHPGLLAPGRSAVAAVAKIGGTIQQHLPFPVPESVTTELDDAQLHAFCRRHSWRIWLKGPFHDALAVHTWAAFEQARTALSQSWKADRLLVQAHVRGHEESICLAAWNGVLLDAIHMEKRLTTPEGKTWAGRVKPLPAKIRDVVAHAVRATGWSGGAEIELLRDADGTRWLMEWNPRFPAWIHGSTLAGHNLVASLVAAASKRAPMPAQPVSDEFTRVVTEIPVHRELSLPPRVEPLPRQLVITGKYGAGLASLSRALDETRESAAASACEAAPAPMRAAAPKVEEHLLADLTASDLGGETPARLYLPETAARGFARVAAKAAATRSVRIQPAYSIKTSPDDRYLALARQHGFLAEAISLLEVERALRFGFQPHEIVLNGPGKWWPQTLTPPPGLSAVFADSREELERLVAQARSGKDVARTIGVRLRLPSIPSRFGIPVGDPDDFAAVVALVRELPRDVALGVHWHMASSGIGVSRWQDGFASALAWARALAAASERDVTTLDLGGGWNADDYASLDFEDLAARAVAQLPALERILVEPGKAVTQPTMALATRVLDVRRDRTGQINELVLDASLAELPLASLYPHRLLTRGADGRLRSVGRGRARLLGRICMEDDCIASSVDVPANTAIGDLFVVLDAGAYERSMSYEFGRG
jgi:diaminopimelate decarboxylase